MMALRIKTKLTHEYFRFKSYIARPKMVRQDRPVILSGTDLCENPIFLIGVHRSGTSLCRRIIDSHSRIACPPETYFLQHFAAMIQDENTFAGFAGLGWDDHALVLREIRKWAARYHEAYRLAKGKPRWADKTPQYIAILHELEQLFGPTAQYIMIFRHPLDVVYSIFKRGWRFSDDHHDLLKNTAMYVSESVRKQLLFVKQYPTRCFCLFYEDLMFNPEKILRAMFEFLEEPWEPNVLAYNESDHNFGSEDPVVRGTHGFIPNFGNWRALNQDQLSSILSLVESTMRDLNYGLDSPCVLYPKKQESSVSG